MLNRPGAVAIDNDGQAQTKMFDREYRSEQQL
jgi:hypothetical protein